MGEQLLDQNAVNAMARAAGFGEPRVGPPPASIGGTGEGSREPHRQQRVTDGQDFFSIFPTKSAFAKRPVVPILRSLPRCPPRPRPVVAAAHRGTFASITRGLGGSLRVVLQEVRREELHRVVRSLLHQRLHPLREDGHHRGLEVLADGEGLHVDLVLRLERRLLRRGRRLGVVVPGVLVRGLGFGRGRLGRNLVCSNGREGWRRRQERGEAGAEEGPPRVAGANRGGARTVGGRVVGHRDARVRSVASRRVGEWPERSGARALTQTSSPEAGRARIGHYFAPCAASNSRSARPSGAALRSSLAGAVGTGLGAPSGRGHARGRRSDDRVAAPRFARRRRASLSGAGPPSAVAGPRGGADAPRGLRPVPPPKQWFASTASAPAVTAAAFDPDPAADVDGVARWLADVLRVARSSGGVGAFPARATVAGEDDDLAVGPLVGALAVGAAGPLAVARARPSSRRGRGTAATASSAGSVPLSTASPSSSSSANLRRRRRAFAARRVAAAVVRLLSAVAALRVRRRHPPAEPRARLRRRLERRLDALAEGARGSGRRAQAAPRRRRGASRREPRSRPCEERLVACA